LPLTKTFHRTILVVDDDSNDLLLIEAAFSEIGVDHIQTANGVDGAVAYLSGHGVFADRKTYPYPNMVITDLKMPKRDGFAFLEHFRQNPDWAVVPTIIFSGSRDNDDIKKAYSLGASAYHVKPSSQIALRTLLKALHDYWLLCEVPEVDAAGKQLATESSHKLGDRFSQNAKRSNTDMGSLTNSPWEPR
jgi:CheY-like chemotaxis protein